jgi:hypothetical protein
MSDDDHKPERSPSGPRPDRGFDGAPRGRGVGIPAGATFKCARCGSEKKDAEIGFDTTCSSCGSALHSCTNCNYFDTGSLFQCRKPVEVKVDSKTKANDCALFEPKTIRNLKSARTTMEAGTGSPTDARAAFDALFKK